MANLYDTPAQAEFINTYVPIKFESLYKASEAASKRADEGQELVDKLSAYGSLGSRSDVDNETWGTEVYGKAKELIDGISADPTAMSDPRIQAKLRSGIRDIASNPLTNILLQNKANYEKLHESYDPRWGTHYDDMIKSHDSRTQGLIDTKAMNYTGWQDRAAVFTKGIGASKLESEGMYDIYGVDPTKLRQVINMGVAETASDPSAIMMAENELRQHPSLVAEYTEKDADGNEHVNINRYISDAMFNASASLLTGREEKVNQVKLSWLNHSRAAARANAKNNNKGLPSDIARTWMSQATEDIGRRKTDKVLGDLEEQLSGVPANKRDEVGTSLVGAAMWNYYKAKEDRADLEKEMKGVNLQISNAAASDNKAALSELTKKKATLARDISEKSEIIQYHMPAVGDFVSSQSRLAVANKSSVFQKEDVMRMEQYPVDGVIAESWAATNVGAPVKMKMIDNSNLNAFTATNTSEMVVSGHTYMGSDPSQFSYGSGLTNDGQASVRKFNELLSKGSLSGSMVWAPAGKAAIGGDGGSRIAGYGYIPEAKLKALGMSQREIALLSRTGGRISASPITLADKEGTPTSIAGSQMTKYVKVPISTRFIDQFGSVSNQVLNHSFDKTKSGVYSDGSYEEEGFE